MKNQLKEFFNLREYEQYFAGDGPNFSFFSVALWALATMTAMFIVFTNLKS